MGAIEASPSLVDVAVPYPVDKLFTYRVPEALRGRVRTGARVLVPFGRRRVTGYVMGSAAALPSSVRVREIAAVVDEEPLLTGGLIDLARRISDHYVHPIGEVMRAMLPATIAGKPRSSAGAPPEDEADDSFPAEAERPELTSDQRSAFEAVRAALAGGGGRFLLHGVTGSGKTEVYLRCIEEALRAGKSALVLIPEIALMPQTTARFRRRFGGAVAVLHSRLGGAARAAIWRSARSGETKVVIGARSAVFAPLGSLGIIVVDEEQDGSYKQEEKPHYNAVTVARFRAEREGAVLLLGSATPSLEAYEESRSGGLGRLVLRSRPGGLELPRVDIVDMRGREGIVSEELLAALEGSLERREQAVILINRRGHASFIQCRECGWIDRCPNCSISLTFHSRGQRLLCHYCGHEEGVPEACPKCGGYRILHRGVGTQRIEMELMNLLPGVRVIRMDLDTTAGRRGHLDVLEKFARGERDVLLGTQMVAKGHHYPNVTVIGVVSADRGLHFPDFRAAEKTFRLLFQAAGRTGRGEKGGRVIVQTYAPEHFIYEFLSKHDYEGFAERELEMRRALGYPPAGRLVLFTVTSRSRERAEEGAAEAARSLAGRLPVEAPPAGASGLGGAAAAILGPTPALVEWLRGTHRMQILVKGRLDDALVRELVRAARESLAKKPGVELLWDVDPMSLS